MAGFGTSTFRSGNFRVVVACVLFVGACVAVGAAVLAKEAEMTDNNPAQWVVYVLLSERLGRTYVGITTDLSRRLDQHNGIRPGGARATRAGRPWVAAAQYGPYETRSKAQQIEHQVKKLRGRARLQF